MTLDEVANTIADPAAYADEARLHRALALLRSDDPVRWVRPPGYHPFWAVTRHADVLEVERNPAVFRNSPRPLLVTARMDELNALRDTLGVGLRPLIHLDGVAHRTIRAAGARWFRPATMAEFEGRLRELAGACVDRMAALGGACDFATDVADDFALRVLGSALGAPESDHSRLFRLTPAGRRGFSPRQRQAAMAGFTEYFGELAAERRARPTGDLASVIANAGLSEFDTRSYYIIVVTAGHDTASAVIAGGLRALIEHPGQLRRLRDDPSLLPAAVEEMIRWVTPVKAFMRTATEDYELGGAAIRAGEAVLLSYPSANRDERVFAEPFRFDVGRSPNRHLAFGHGPHHCLGAPLARLEIAAFFAELLPRLDEVRLAGQPRHIATTFSGGLKNLPIRYRLRACAPDSDRAPDSRSRS